MNKFVAKIRKDVVGATAIEYGLIAAAIAVVILAAAQLIGTRLTSTFNTISNAV